MIMTKEECKNLREFDIHCPLTPSDMPKKRIELIAHFKQQLDKYQYDHYEYANKNEWVFYTFFEIVKKFPLQSSIIRLHIDGITFVCNKCKSINWLRNSLNSCHRCRKICNDCNGKGIVTVTGKKCLSCEVAIDLSDNIGQYFEKLVKMLISFESRRQACINIGELNSGLLTGIWKRRRLCLDDPES